jgi:hypothetical protein
MTSCSYLIADYERMNFSISQCLFDSGAQSNIVTIESISAANSTPPSSPSSHSSVSGGAIGGIVVAVVAVVIAIGLLFWLRAKRKFPFKNATAAELSAGNSAALNPEQNALGPELPGSDAKGLPAEGLDSTLTEMEDGSTVAGYYAPKERHELHDPAPAAQELPSQESDFHEMFDESVYREMHDGTAPS